MPLPTPTRETKREFKEFKKPAWFFPTVGTHRIRLLEPLDKVVVYYVHWVERQKNYVNCLGDEQCPICLENRKIEIENPETYRKEPGWNPYSTKYAINVLDRTLVKKCTECESENKMLVSSSGSDFSPTCWKCKASIMGVVAEPSNTVKILSRHAPLFRDGFESLEKTVLDLEGNSIPITSYDIILNVTKKDRGYNIMPVPQTHLNDVIDMTNYELFDIDDTLLKLTREEVIQYLRGVSLSDIFSARKAEESVSNVVSVTTEVATTTEDALASAQDKVKNLFSGVG